MLSCAVCAGVVVEEEATGRGGRGEFGREEGRFGGDDILCLRVVGRLVVRGR